MKHLPLVLALGLLFPAGGALAHGHDAPSVTIHDDGCDSPARWSDRFDPDEARYSIDSDDGDATLLITDAVVALQLSDRKLREVRRELRDEEDDSDNPLARAVMAVVMSSIRTLLDHSAVCSIRDLRDIQYKHDRLVFLTDDGAHVFGNLDVNGRDVIAGFRERDARRFIAEFQRLKQRLR